MRPYSSRGGCPELRHFESLELYDKMAVGYTISFSKFMQSLLSLSLPVEGSTVPTLWPMPLPFPEMLVRMGPESSALPFPVRALQKMLNLVVAALSWLHMGRPAKAPAAMALRQPLSSPQWAVVRRLERLLHEVHHTKTVVPSDMGRNAVKVEGLDFLLRELHEAAAQLPKFPIKTVRRRPDALSCWPQA